MELEPHTLSKQARSLWAKSSPDFDNWLPLYAHLSDTAYVARLLWNNWLPSGTKSFVAGSLIDPGQAEHVVVLLAAAHDLGKAAPAFQGMPCWWSDTSGEYSLRWKPEGAGLYFSPYLNPLKAPKHPIAGQVLFERMVSGDRRVVRSFSSIIGGHHGKPSQSGALLNARESHPKDLGIGDELWESVQYEMFHYALALADMDEQALARITGVYLPAQAASVLEGLVIMADWIASNQDLFPLAPLRPGDEEDELLLSRIATAHGLIQRHEEAWDTLGLLPSWDEAHKAIIDLDACNNPSAFLSERFSLPQGAAARPVQDAVVSCALKVDDPGIMVIEAPMGEGKTEAALMAAEVFAGKTGRGGVCLALPTMATTDAMFSRVHSWLVHLPQEGDKRQKSIYLAHGKAQLNEEFQGIVHAGCSRYAGIGQDLAIIDGGDSVVASDWMFGRKRGMLANFVVCTVDQVLMGALRMKHVSLRHLALANKVVIIDECHAYDAYMRMYLNGILEWLGAWGTPVILLSATLPENQRAEMVGAYLKGRCAAEVCECLTLTASSKHTSDNLLYPLITYTDGLHVWTRAACPSSRITDVSIKLIGDNSHELACILRDILVDGGCAGIVCDTVGRAQELALLLAESFSPDEVMLTHARFIDLDRMENEKRIRSLLGSQTRAGHGRPHRLVVVGTQVLEQSLDIDFDILVTDIAPIDLLLQRMGRMHRHARGEGERERPERVRDAMCLVRGVDGWEDRVPRFVRAACAVYDEASLMEALAVLRLTEEKTVVRVELPREIPSLVQGAYGEHTQKFIPDAWHPVYEEACKARVEERERKRARARTNLLPCVSEMSRNEETLTGWYEDDIAKGATPDDDAGPRAVRDTQETVEVMAMELRGGRVHLLPWVGDSQHGVKNGAEVPSDYVPNSRVAKLAAQSTVRLPLTMCASKDIEQLIDELERAGGDFVGAWQESPWLAGKLVLLLRVDEAGRLSTALHGWEVVYSRDSGLMTHRLTVNKS